MFASLSRWLTARTARRVKLNMAIKHFETTGERASRGMSRVIHEGDRGTVVEICYGDTRPPWRKWYMVSETDDVVELSWEEVQRQGEKPWR
jgi:hypothetical protein